MLHEVATTALLLILALLAACSGGNATPLYVTATPAPVGVSVGSITSEAPPFLFSTPTLPFPFTGITAEPGTPTPIPERTLDVCLPVEPQTLYDFTSVDRDSAWARAVVLETLRDGPFDHLNFEYQPILLEKIPSLQEGDAVLNAVTINKDETIVDVGGYITTLTGSGHYYDASGAEQAYSGDGPAQAMQMMVTFKLKDGLRWEDGAPLTADDVLYGWQLAKDPANRVADHYLTNRLLDPVVVDPRTIQITYLPGYKDIYYYTRFPTPYPRHLYSSRTVRQLANDDIVNRRPISFGPFILQEWAPGDHITVVKNPNYSRAAEGLPKLDGLIFHFIPDSTRMVERTKNGECDLSLSPPSGDSFFAPHLDSIALAEAAGAYKSVSVPSTTFEHLDFNISPVANYRGVAGTGLFQDARLRRAFAYCINRREIIDVLLRGRADIPSVYVPPSHPFFEGRNLTAYDFDPAKGKALLKEAGWEDRNGDGIVEKQGRLSLDYVFGPHGNTLRASIAALLEAQLKQNCGIEIVPRELDRADLFGDFPDGVLFGRQYDLAQLAWVGGYEEPYCYLYSRNEWTGLGDGQPDQYGRVGYPGGGNNVGYINQNFDANCLNALASLDPAQKKSFHQEAMQTFTQEVPSIILFFRPKIALVRPNVSGFALDTTQDSVLWNVETMDIAP